MKQFILKKRETKNEEELFKFRHIGQAETEY